MVLTRLPMVGFFPRLNLCKASSLATVWSGVSTDITHTHTHTHTAASYLFLGMCQKCNTPLIWSFQNVHAHNTSFVHRLYRHSTISGLPLFPLFNLDVENLNWHNLSWTKSQYWNDDPKSSVSKSSVLWKPLWIFLMTYQDRGHKYS